MRVFILGCLGLCLTAALCLAGAPAKRGKAPAPTENEPAGIGSVDEHGIWYHTGKYPPLALAWEADRRVPQAEGVFPHPVLPDRVVAATRAGLFLSDDGGGEWKALPEAAAGRVGIIRSVAFSPGVPDTFFLGSDHKGVWLTEDCGKTFRQVGSKQAGLASDDTAQVIYLPCDRRFQTVLAAHGDAAAGISVTSDGGKTWRVVMTDYHVRRIIGGRASDRDLALVASKKGAPDVQNVYQCTSFDDFLVELVRDVIPVDAAVAPPLQTSSGRPEDVLHDAPIYFATADGGLCRVTSAGSEKLGDPVPASLVSVGCTQGPNADVRLLYAYEPKKLGMVASTDNWKSVAPAGAGLYVGAFIKEGARIRAGAGGTRFYAAINDVLYVGSPRRASLMVSRAEVAPAFFSFEDEAYRAAMTGLREQLRTLANERFGAGEARQFVRNVRDARAHVSETNFTVTAKVAAAGGTPGSVTVDLSRLGGSALTPMLDDGRHGDGAAGDGVYGAQFHLDPRRLKSDTRDRRPQWPGPVGLSVTVAAPDGTLAGAVALLSIFDRPDSFDLSDRKVEAIPVDGRPWTCAIGQPWTSHDITAYHALTFWIKTDAAGVEEITVQLRDTLAYSEGSATPPVPIFKEGFVAGGKSPGDWRLVTIPLARLLKDALHFETGRMGQVVLSGEGKVSGEFWINKVRFHVSPEDLKAYEGANTP